MVPVPEIDVEQCIGCGICAEDCPTNAAQLVNDKAVIARPEDCTYCTDCEVICPSGAIKCYFEIILVEDKSVSESKQEDR